MGSVDAGLSTEDADAVYDVLVTKCGARESGREHFRFSQTREHVTEWRFQGALGFGGKFWRTSGWRSDSTWGEVWRVDCYPEDRTAERDTMVSSANAALSDLQAQ